MSTDLPAAADGLADDPIAREIASASLADEGLAGLSTDWSVPWSDLMMVLFILFVVLYAYERAERAVPEAFRSPEAFADERTSPAFTEPGSGPDAHGRLVAESRALVEATGSDDVELLVARDDVRVSVAGDLFFDLGSAALRPATIAFLDRLAPILARSDADVRVVGHTDSFPIASREYPTNWELSAARASRVARHLIERGRLDPRRFAVEGHSMYRPAAPDTTLANKARNRRVEIVVTPRGLEAPHTGAER